MLLESALAYLSMGICVIATDENKRALFPWKRYQGEMMTAEEITRQLTHPKAASIAAICGKISGNMEVIDVDCKNDTEGSLFNRLCDNIPSEILDKLHIVKTKSGGYHIYFRCEKIEGNQKLASRLPTLDEKSRTPGVSQIVLIETR